MEQNQQKFTLNRPKTVQERIEYLRQTDLKFREEEKIVNETKERIRPK